MTGKLYFRDNRDITVGSILYDFFYIFLGVETTVCLSVVFAAVASDDGFFTHTSDFGEFRIFFDLDSPALVVRQVPVKTIHFVHGQHVDICLDLIQRK